ncbi:MAG: Peptidoglycan-binding domain 1 protein [Candidatus Woesebacteria bacterium GW2011_GWB1_43_14]|uniref:Peptidoglycan-binding domain 1 protein n=1 Tax=Candidatus Woesebacteria bacterium GW2011_GWB1_43_14 TaxID=1618578 RepID=A0A0G1DMM8_9BACT|nr:MAG: hypothetical protein UV51_C0002G0003 [Candidatus Woesebacteria bacterium GW2011_GWC1_42_9]KKS98904.1 MAG: Peptidoglycan-binding domain 1 protein [Candidatus Woesebacteria bacterium GW2011_GWB1_43_14]
MRFFKRVKSSSAEASDDRHDENYRTRKLDAGKPENGRKRRRKKDERKPWGRGERYLILFVIIGTALMSGLLALSARSWKLPGVPRVTIPGLSLKKTFTFEGETVSTEEFSGIESRLEGMVSGLSGVYGVYIVRLDSGESYGLMKDEIFQAASLIKLPAIAGIYMEADQGNINLNDEVAILEEDRVGGSGSLVGAPAGSKYSYRELVNYMGNQSDNTAFRMVRRTLGDEKINDVIVSLGMTHTSLENNETTPEDIANFFTLLFEGKITSSRRAKEIVDALTNTSYEEWIPAGITGYSVAHKYGREVHVVNDAGIVFSDEPFVLVIMSKGVVETEADKIIPELAKEVFEYEGSH